VKGWFARRRRAEDPLGTGLWKRLHDDCATAVRDTAEHDELLPLVRAWCEQAQRRWPSSGLDVPADPDGLAAFARLQAVRRMLREAAYRDRLDAGGQGGADQARLREAAVRTARELLAPGPES
jgi:hypothetical protein